MTDQPIDVPGRSFSESEAKRILSRAAELDALGAASFTATDLKRIAGEASISPTAVDLALREALAASAKLPSTVPTSRWSKAELARGGGMLAAGGVLGALAVVTDGLTLGPASAAAVFAPTAAFTLYRALWHRWHGSLSGFLQEAVLVLGSFAISATVMEGAHATTPALVWAALCAIGGSGVVSADLNPRLSRPASAASELPTNG